MAESSSGPDDSTIRRLARANGYAIRSIDLESIVVEYEHRPDRCTIAPRECTDDERTTTWLSADVDAIVDLEELR